MQIPRCSLLNMSLKGIHIPSFSKKYLLLSSKVSATRDFAAGYQCGSAFTFGQGMLQCIRFIHTRAAFLSLNNKNKWKQNPWVIRCRGNNGASSDKSDDVSSDGPSKRSGFGSTRLARIVQDTWIKLTKKFKELRKNFPMKVLFLLLGFYCASVVATSIGQTGDWDILSAGLAVAIVEGIGALMYRAYPLIEKIHSLVTMINYWKAGLCLGLFLDAFKYEIDVISVLFDSFNHEIDLISMFLW